MLTIEQKRDLIEKQIEFQHKIQSVGINLVNCGSCGSVLFHECNDEENIICPFCYEEMSKSDCPDFFYEGLELSGEFEFNK